MKKTYFSLDDSPPSLYLYKLNAIIRYTVNSTNMSRLLIKTVIASAYKQQFAKSYLNTIIPI